MHSLSFPLSLKGGGRAMVSLSSSFPACSLSLFLSVLVVGGRDAFPFFSSLSEGGRVGHGLSKMRSPYSLKGGAES